MALQFSVTLRNNQLDQFETTLGASAKLRIYTGAPPANTAASATGTLLVEMNLPADFMSAASGGSKALLGSWTGTASGTGTAGYFRFVDNAGTTTHAQGTVGTAGTDMIINNTSIAASQVVTASSFTLNAGNA